MPNPIENVKIEMDLSKIDQWTPEQKSEAGDLKAVLENVDKDTLTADELKAHDKLMMKLDNVTATQPNVWLAHPMEPVNGLRGDVMDRLTPEGSATSADSAANSQPHTDAAPSADSADAKPREEY